MTAPSGASGASRATPATGGASAARAIATIAANELRRTARDRTAMIFIVVLPVMIIVLIGTTFGDMEGFDVGVIDRDGTTASHDLVATLDGRDGLSLERFDSIDALRREVRTGALDRGGDATVELIADPTSSTAAAVQASVRAAVGDAAVQMAAVRSATDAGGLDPATAERQAAALAEDLPRAGVRSQPVDEGDTPELGSFDYTAPSNLVLFTFVNTVVVGSIIALERKQGITRRLLTTPHGTGTILAGIGTAKLLFALLQSTLIVVIAAVFFDVGWGDPLGAGLLVVTFALVATAVGLLVGAVVSDPEQAQAAAVPIAIGLAMLGGCMWPLEIVPPVMRTIGHVAPHAWAMDGWIALVFEGEPAGAIATELAVLAAYAAVLGLLARRQLRRALTR